jgi:hypothetical protein
VSQTPSNFVDPFPKRGPWREAADSPELYSWDNEILLSDGRALHAVFMGGFWWAESAKVEPFGWRKVVNAGMTFGAGPKRPTVANG